MVEPGHGDYEFKFLHEEQAEQEFGRFVGALNMENIQPFLLG